MLWSTFSQIFRLLSRMHLSNVNVSVTLKTDIQKPHAQRIVNGTDCPYQYILDIYGHQHFRGLISMLDEGLEKRDPSRHQLILEIMDAIHFGAILVDDVADNSLLRKGRTAAHHIYGSAETVNRAYLRIFEIIGRCQAEHASLVPAILASLAEIHKGQDDSLVWRRDGFPKCTDRAMALELYQQCASLKTGALFRLLGQLVSGNHDKDQALSDLAWYCHLQNDCKNVFSSDVVVAKGALAEDLSNGEYSYPILVALHASSHTHEAVLRAMQFSKDKSALQAAIVALQTEEVRGFCLAELNCLETRNQPLAALWGRKEVMSVHPDQTGSQSRVDDCLNEST